MNHNVPPLVMAPPTAHYNQRIKVMFNLLQSSLPAITAITVTTLYIYKHSTSLQLSMVSPPTFWENFVIPHIQGFGTKLFP